MALPVSGMFKRSAAFGVGAAPERNGTANNAAAKKAENAKRILDILPSRQRAGVAVTFDGRRRFLVKTFRRSNGAGRQAELSNPRVETFGHMGDIG